MLFWLADMEKDTHAVSNDKGSRVHGAEQARATRLATELQTPSPYLWGSATRRTSLKGALTREKLLGRACRKGTCTKSVWGWSVSCFPFTCLLLEKVGFTDVFLKSRSFSGSTLGLRITQSNMSVSTETSEQAGEMADGQCSVSGTHGTVSSICTFPGALQRIHRTPCTPLGAGTALGKWNPHFCSQQWCNPGGKHPAEPHPSNYFRGEVSKPLIVLDYLE